MVDLEEELDRSFCSSKNVLCQNDGQNDKNNGRKYEDDDEDGDGENGDGIDITDLSHEMTLYSCHRRTR
jgi:hypothetical protein